MSEIGKRFSDINYYNKQMSLGMEDKLFFVDKLPRHDKYLFVDFGCADGSMISQLCEIYKGGAGFVGYDISEQMIDFAKTKFQGESKNVIFTTSWDEVQQQLKYYTNTVLILSSVIHEVYSYATKDSDIQEFWDRVLKSGFKYIVVRDMMLSSRTICREPNSDDVAKIRTNGNYIDQIQDFEEIWGPIEGSNKNLLHFLLKYRWKINWKREVNENYFPIIIEEFLAKMEDEAYSPTDRYRLDYFEKFRIKFLEDRIYEDFHVNLEDTTHIKAIFINDTEELPF